MIENPLFIENLDKKMKYKKNEIKSLARIFLLVGLCGSVIIFSFVLFISKQELSYAVFVMIYALAALCGILLLFYLVEYRYSDFQIKFYKDYIATKNKPDNLKKYKYNYSKIKEFQFFDLDGPWSINIKINSLMQVITKREYYDDPEGLLNFLKSTPNINFVEIKTQK